MVTATGPVRCCPRRATIDAVEPHVRTDFRYDFGSSKPILLDKLEESMGKKKRRSKRGQGDRQYDIDLSAKAFKGSHKWPIEIKKRFWRWNNHLLVIRDHILTGFDPASMATRRYVEKMVGCEQREDCEESKGCKGCKAIRLNLPPPMSKKIVGKGKTRREQSIPNCCQQNACPYRAYARFKRRLRQGKYADLHDCRRPHRMLILGHQYIEADDAEPQHIWDSLDRLAERIVGWRTKTKRIIGWRDKAKRHYARGGMITFEIDRARHPDSNLPCVFVHAHALVEPRTFGNPDAEPYPLSPALRHAWRVTAESGETDLFLSNRRVTWSNVALENRMLYMYGVEKRRLKLLDGLLSPHDDEDDGTALPKWNAKGSTDPHQLLLMLARYTWKGRCVRWFGTWYGSQEDDAP